MIRAGGETCSPFNFALIPIIKSMSKKNKSDEVEIKPEAKKTDSKMTEVCFISSVALVALTPPTCNPGEKRKIPKAQADELIKAGIAKLV